MAENLILFSKFALRTYLTLKKYFFKSGRMLTLVLPFDKNIRYSNKYVFIIEPNKFRSNYIIISHIWKRYFSIHFPNTKLIVIGFCNYQSRNYIDLLNPPKNFEKFIKNALTVSEDWEIPIDGVDLQRYLKRFFEGHSNQSLISKLNQLQTTFNSAETLIKTREATFKEVQNELLIPFGKSEWDELIKRWYNYLPYFEYLPFYPSIQEIDKIFQEISNFFVCNEKTQNLFLKVNGSEKLKNVSRNLLEIDRLYIRPEKYPNS